MTTVLYAHPYEKSFNHAILEEVKSRLDAQNKDYTVLDLYADGFNPALEAASLRLYSKGETADPIAARYLETLIKSDEFIMIFPIWWGAMPAIVKGFFDKVMLSGKAYQYSPAGELIPDKININRTIIFSTSQGQTEIFAPFFLNYFKPLVLEAVGMKNLEWYNCSETAHGPAKNREDFLSLVREKI
ncbi:MAG: NAD(P)H-dependent oxidoreductase [Muribaculaceae bacterium]|nr:NAD(P)H-dependent oxidoreductase [Muribaculaceae bacterium]